MQASNPGHLPGLNRRGFIRAATAGLAVTSAVEADEDSSPTSKKDEPAKKKLTTFQIACMTLPYARFSLQRALEGIRSAGYRYVAWGTTHQEDGKRVPVLPSDASPEKARELAKKCRG